MKGTAIEAFSIKNASECAIAVRSEAFQNFRQAGAENLANVAFREPSAPFFSQPNVRNRPEAAIGMA